MLVIGGGCHDCHTPMKPGPNGAEPDMTKMLSGHPESISITAPMKPVGPWTVATNDTNTAWSGPWGVSFAANLTPDKETGLNMNERNFVIALKTGAHLGTARPILPPMPWPWYGQLGDEALEGHLCLPPDDSSIEESGARSDSTARKVGPAGCSATGDACLC